MNYVNYFKTRDGFNRFFLKLKDKYIKTGKFVGLIKLDNISEVEVKDLSEFFNKFYFKGENIVISLKTFNKIMNKSKYDNFDFKELIDEYFGCNIKTKFENKAFLKKTQDEFWKSILDNAGIFSKEWLSTVLESKNSLYSLIIKRYNKEKDKLKKDLLKTFACLDNLSTEEVYLPVFSSMYTKDPHFLDIDAASSILFTYGLCFKHNCNYPTNRAEKIDLYLKSKIIVDPLSNWAITYGLLGSELLSSFTDFNEPLIINLYNMNQIDKIDTLGKKVFIFENPSLLNIILQSKIKVPTIITGGNPNYIVYKILDKLVESGNSLFYNGDFDPEGLLIASKLKNRYYDKLNLFCYNLEDYNRCLSKNKISLSRLKKLDKIDIKDLDEIKKLLLEYQYSGYQESNADFIINYIRNLDDKIE